MGKRALITGITGFVGSHLAEYLLKEGLEVIGTTRPRSKTENIDHLKGQVTLVEADIRDYASILGIIDKHFPFYIFHLAAQSFVPMSWKAPSETLVTNIVGTANILEAIKFLEVGEDIKILVAGTSEEYGLVSPDFLPIKESCPLRPQSPYGVSKVAADLLTQQYTRSYNLRAVVTRAFNHTGPRRGEVFVSSNFAKQLVEIEKGIRDKIMVGNLTAKRDFSDVRDIVRAYWLAIEKGKSGEAYNICSGNAISIEELLLKMVKMTNVLPKTIVEDIERLRPSDVPILVGDCSKFKEQTGWEPKIPLEKTLEDLVNYWREKV